MCGIAGFLRTHPDMRQIAGAMGDALQHRGPDASGVWCDADTGIALAHRRLSIIDLSDHGAQPMTSISGRYVLSYNGEIYNFLALREELESLGAMFRGHSDTEVLLTAIDHWGLETTLDRIIGMFAFALWDRSERLLHLARDRIGEKPLYYGWCGDAFLFGSELKALRTHPDFDDTLDRAALAEYVRFGWIPEPLCIYQSIRKLPPGTRLCIETGKRDTQPQPYWRARDVCETAIETGYPGSAEDASAELESLLRKAVRQRMVSDVDLGALLSGGVDSATIVALMQRDSDRPVKTFTIGFEDPRFDESSRAAAIAAHLGTEHHEQTVTPQDCLDAVPDIATVWDEPFADISEIPTLLVSRMAREHVKVVLTGDGGDEMFGGYAHYFKALAARITRSRLPSFLQQCIRSGAMALSNAQWQMARQQCSAGQGIRGWRRWGAKMEKRTRGWTADNVQQMMLERYARYARPQNLVVGTTTATPTLANPANWLQTDDALAQMRQLDCIGYLPGDILTKVDRASMSVGLEARAPLLDTGILEFAFRLPSEYLLGDDGGKQVLRNVMNRHLPAELTQSPKRGFGAPVENWLRGPLREWAGDLLDPARLKQQGLFDTDAVANIQQQHQCGWHNHANLMWALLMFQAWSDEAGPA